MRRNVPGTSKPECAPGSICFSGEVHDGQTFRKDLNPDLEFVIGLPGGFAVGSSTPIRRCPPKTGGRGRSSLDHRWASDALAWDQRQRARRRRVDPIQRRDQAAETR